MDINILHFHFYKTFRISPEDRDKIQIKLNILEAADDKVIDSQHSAQLIDFNLNGMVLSTNAPLYKEDRIQIYLSVNKFFSRWDLTLEGYVVSSFSNVDNDTTNFGIKLVENLELKYFIKEYIHRLSKARLRKSILKSIDTKKINNKKEGLELFSLMLQMYEELISDFKSVKTKSTLINLLNIGSQIFKNSDATVYKIDPENNLLVPYAFSEDAEPSYSENYHKGLPGVVFTSGNIINLEFKENKNTFGIESKSCFAVLATPIFNSQNQIIGVIEFKQTKHKKRFTFQDELQLKVFGSIVNLYFNKYMPQSKTSTLNIFNPNALRTNGYLGLSREAEHVNIVVNKLKNVQDNILIIGETGTGKTYLSHYLHDEGYLYNQEKICIDCNAISGSKEFEEELLKSKLHEKGTLILENINCLSIQLQKVLFERLLRSEKKIISLSSRDINGLVEENLFLKDLFSIVSTCYIHLKPLRNRKQDIESIARFFLYRECQKRKIPYNNIGPKTKKNLLKYDWPGNLSELKREIIKFLMVNPTAPLEINLKNSASSNLKDHELVKFYKQLVKHTDDSIPFNQLSKMVAVLLNELADGDIKGDYDEDIPKAA